MSHEQSRKSLEFSHPPVQVRQDLDAADCVPGVQASQSPQITVEPENSQSNEAPEADRIDPSADCIIQLQALAPEQDLDETRSTCSFGSQEDLIDRNDAIETESDCDITVHGNQSANADDLDSSDDNDDTVLESTEDTEKLPVTDESDKPVSTNQDTLHSEQEIIEPDTRSEPRETDANEKPIESISSPLEGIIDPAEVIAQCAEDVEKYADDQTVTDPVLYTAPLLAEVEETVVDAHEVEMPDEPQGSHSVMVANPDIVLQTYAVGTALRVLANPGAEQGPRVTKAFPSGHTYIRGNNDDDKNNESASIAPP